MVFTSLAQYLAFSMKYSFSKFRIFWCWRIINVIISQNQISLFCSKSLCRTKPQSLCRMEVKSLEHLPDSRLPIKAQPTTSYTNLLKKTNFTIIQYLGDLPFWRRTARTRLGVEAIRFWKYTCGSSFHIVDSIVRKVQWISWMHISLI